VLQPKQRTFLVRLLLRLFARARPDVTVKFEHKNKPINIELLLRETRSIPLVEGSFAKPFMFKADFDSIERAHKEATLAAERSAANMYVTIEGFDMEEEDSPRAHCQQCSSAFVAAAMSEGSSAVAEGASPGKRRHSIEAPPSFRRTAESSSEPSSPVSPPACKRANSGKMRKLECRLAAQMNSRVGEMHSRAERVAETKRTLQEAARNMPLPARLPAPSSLSGRSSESPACDTSTSIASAHPLICSATTLQAPRARETDVEPCTAEAAQTTRDTCTERRRSTCAADLMKKRRSADAKRKLQEAARRMPSPARLPAPPLLSGRLPESLACDASAPTPTRCGEKMMPSPRAGSTAGIDPCTVEATARSSCEVLTQRRLSTCAADLMKKRRSERMPEARPATAAGAEQVSQPPAALDESLVREMAQKFRPHCH
jgi:hypothetical protein